MLPNAAPTQYERYLVTQRRVRNERAIGNIFGDIWDVVTSVADGVVSAAHIIPGVDWAGDQMKDFANSTVGKIALTAFTSGLYGASEATLSAYTALAPQLASLAFAFPGLLAGDSFTKAYVSELTLRIKQTAEYVSPEAGAALGKAIEPIATEIMNNPSIQALIAKGTDDLPNITKKIVDAGVKEATDYATQKAIDLLNKTNDAAKKFFDNYGNEVDAAGNRMLGAEAAAEAAAFAVAVARKGRGQAVMPDWLRAIQASSTQTSTAGASSMLDAYVASQVASPAASATATASAKRKAVLVGGGAFLAALALLKLVVK